MRWTNCLYSIRRGDNMAWKEVAYQYDGRFEGFLCCVFMSYLNKERPIAFFEDEESMTFYTVRSVITRSDQASRVMRSIVKQSPAAGKVLRRGFLTCMDEKELRLYDFVRKIYSEGPGFLKNQTDPAYYPIMKAIRHLNGEIEKYRGFIRFSDYNGYLGAEIEPKNQVLPLLRSHFCNRCADEDFFIFDRTHRELLLHSKGCSRILEIDGLHLDLPGAEELNYRELWKCFYESIAIRERLNPKRQNSFLPKRYRENMTEFQSVAHETECLDIPGGTLIPVH